MSILHQKKLSAFYDLAVSPSSFDFFTFLQLAELFRKRYNLDAIEVIFVPGDKQGFRGDNFKPLHVNQMMVRNVLLPGCHLLASCVGIHWLQSRDEATGLFNSCQHVFPRGYKPEHPVSDYIFNGISAAHLRGENITLFAAPSDFRKHADSFFENVASGKRVITVTLRGCSYHATSKRQNNISELKKLFDSLDSKMYQPVIIPDAEFPFDVPEELSNYPVASAGATNLLFRMAIYERAYLNLCIPNGPSVLMLFSSARSLMFKIVADDCPSTTNAWYTRMKGTRVGDQVAGIPKTTQYVWENDTFENMRRALDLMIKKIDLNDDLSAKHGFSDEGHALATINSALLYTFERMNIMVMGEDVLTLKKIKDIGKIIGGEIATQLSPVQLLSANEGVKFPKGGTEAIRGLDKKFGIGLF